MNGPTHPGGTSPAYQDGVFGWAAAQVELIRAGAVQHIDWEHLPPFRSRSWLLSIREQHRQFQRRLHRNPGLRLSLESIRAEAYRQARVAAQTETGLAVETFPLDPPGWNVINNPSADESGIPAR